jgi:hypothetical protein
MTEVDLDKLKVHSPFPSPSPAAKEPAMTEESRHAIAADFDREFTQNTLPTLEQHLRVAENLQAHGGERGA